MSYLSGRCPYLVHMVNVIKSVLMDLTPRTIMMMASRRQGRLQARAGMASRACALSSLAVLCEIPYLPPHREASANDDDPIDRILTTYRHHEDLRRHLLRSQDLSRQGKRTSPSHHPSRSRTLGGPWRHMRGMGGMNGGPRMRVIFEDACCCWN
jgi:hypothetical protein